MKRPIYVFAAACVLVTAAEWLTFHYYDRLLAAPSPVPVHRAHPAFAVRSVRDITPLGGNPQLVDVSDDGTMLAYVDPNNVLRVRDLQKDQEVYTRPLTAPADYVRFISDTNLFVGTKEDKSGYGNLQLNTIDTSLLDVRTVQTFSYLDKTAEFLHIAFSQYTNDIYVVIGSSTSTVVYHFDTNGALSQVPLGSGPVENIAVPQTTGSMFFQLRSGTSPAVYLYDHGRTSLVADHAVILRTLSDDLYYGVLDDQGLVTQVLRLHQGTSKVVAALPQPVLPDHLFVDTNGHVMVVNASSCEDVTAGKTYDLPPHDRVVIRGGALLLWAHGSVIAIAL